MDPSNWLAERFLELTIKAIWRQLGYLIFYRSNIEELKKQIEELQNERSSVQHSVDEATNNAENIEAKVERWLNEVNEKTREAEKFYEEESQAKTGCTSTSCPNLWSRHQLSQRAKKMAQEVVEIHGKGNFTRVSYCDPPQGIQSRTTFNEGLESRRSIMNQIIEALRDPTVNMIGLSGLGGVGKTTLAKQVAKKAEDENMFETVIMVTIKDNPIIEKIQADVAEMLGMTLNEKNETLRAGHLYKRLKQEKNMLLILDDLWEKLDLDQVGIPFDGDAKTSKNNVCYKILLTSRNENLLVNQMKCERNIKVGVLSEGEAWKLFKAKAELTDDSNDPDMLSITYEVAQQCGGLPIAIITTASALRNKSPTEWRDTLKRFKNPIRRSVTGIKEADSIIKLSYDNLNNKELQSIFLLSAILSHDPLTIYLLMYSMGLGLLQGVHTIEDAQDGLYALVSKLKALSLLNDSFSNDRFAMHDVVRDVALSIVCKEQHALVVRHEKHYKFPDKGLIEGYTSIWVDKSNIGELPKELYCPTLELLILNSKDSFDLRIPNMFFKSMPQLKVMGLTNMQLSSLPSSLSLLAKLTTLCLHSCMLRDITEVGKLKNLKFLSLAYSIIKQLPCELGQLTCLQMLNLTHCSQLEVIPPNILSSLKNLEVLHMENSFNQWEAEGSSKGNENASLAELKHLSNLSSLDIHVPNVFVWPKDLFLQNSLKRYRVFIGEGWKGSSNYETSKTLKLKLKTSIHLLYGVQRLLEEVEDLYLDELIGIKNVLRDLDGRGFPHLKHLWIQNNDQIEYIIKSTRLVDVFPKLETLNLHNLLGLEELCEGHHTTKSFQNLRVIKVRGCDRLKCLFSFSMVGILCKLVEIDICYCESIEKIVVFNTSEETLAQNLAANVIVFHQLRHLRIDHLPSLTNFSFAENAIGKSLFSSKVAFPKLETLELSDIKIQNIWEGITLTRSLSTSNSGIVECSDMRITWDDQLPHGSFSNLKTLFVSGCHDLVKLIPLHLLKTLSNLEELQVVECNSLEMVFDFKELENYKETHLSLGVQLRKLELRLLPKLKHVWWGEDSQAFVSFQSLQQVNVSTCKNLTSIFPATIAKSMPHLEELKIIDCGIDVIVAKDEVSESAATFVFPKLILLHLSNLSNLRNFYPRRHTSEWPRLQNIFIGSCHELEIFQNEVSSGSELQEEAHNKKYPLFFDEQVIPNLEMLRLDKKHAVMLWNGQFPSYHFHNVKVLRLQGLPKTTTFPYGLLKRFPKLEQLDISYSDMEIFSCLGPLGDDAPQLPPFTKLSLRGMKYLKHIWNEHSPSSVSFGNLTDLYVYSCNGLLNLLTSSTARSLIQLTRLKICRCNKIEEIITEHKDEVEKEIVFEKLKYLELFDLPELKSFCSHNYTFIFPSLDEVITKECFKMSMFSSGIIDTPLLKGVKAGFRGEHWERNLNKTIQLLFKKKFDRVQLLKLHEYPELRSTWNGKLPHHASFRKLYSLDVDNCDFLSEYVIPAHLLKSLSNLKKLEVRNCDSIEAVFDLKGINMDQEAQTLLAMSLEKLKLDHLPNLKYVWNKDTNGINCFQYLQEVYASDCQSLRNIFPVSIAKGLTQLERLDINSCGVEVIAAKDETPRALLCFVFPRLKYLLLQQLPNFKSFHPQRHVFECPQLTDLWVHQCKKVKVFGSETTGIAESHEKNEVETAQPLFLVEKVIPNLEVLRLSHEHTVMLWNGQFPSYHFPNVKVLGLYGLPKAATFPYGLLKRFPKLDQLENIGYGGKEIFSYLGPLGDDAPQLPPFTKLILRAMKYLEHIWNEYSPSSISFGNLTDISVYSCNGLVNLLTSSTARSLVQLTRLKICRCNKIEEIITKQGDEVEKEMVFKKLKFLRLFDLPELRSFCSHNYTFIFPSLDEVIIEECFKMSMFSTGIIDTPLLKGVKVKQGNQEEHWESNLDKTIQLLFKEKVGALSEEVA